MAQKPTNYLNQQLGGDEQKDNESGKKQFNDQIMSSSKAKKKYGELLGYYDEYEKKRRVLAERSRIQEYKDALKNEQLTDNERLVLEDKLKKEEQRVNQRALDATLAYQKKVYQKGSVVKKAEMARQSADAIAEHRKEVDEKYAEEYAAAEGDANKKRSLTMKHKAFVAKSIEEERAARDKARALENTAAFKEQENLMNSLASMKEKPNVKNALKLGVEFGKLGTEGLKELVAAQRKNLDAQKEETKNRKADMDGLEAEGFSKDSKEYKEAEAAYVESLYAENAEMMKSAMLEATSAIKDAINSSFKEAEELLVNTGGIINARLQGTNKDFEQISNKITTNLAVNPYVESRRVLETFSKLSEAGVAYNIEQRAFLGTISDKIAQTFDAFDSNLLRIIRLQQADTTAARLGMEATLNKLLNGMYNDTSYLSDTADSVTQAVIDASSTMTHKDAAEFEFVLQKWLGSLGSLGASNELITQIAEGINYLATGDVQNLSSNTQIQTLVAMSAAEAGLSLSDMLIEGLDAQTTNKLMQSMITYLKKISEDSENMVVRAAYGDVFNLSMSDMRAISNMTASEIATISGTNLSYSGMQSELVNQMNLLSSRTTMGAMLNTVYENAMYAAATDLVNNPITYGMVKMLDFMEEKKLDMNIPFVNAMGFGLDLNTSVQDLLNLGVGLSQALALSGNILSGLANGGGMNLDKWEATEYNNRGGSVGFTTSSLSGGTSASTYISNSSSDDMQKSTLSSATDDAEETSKITNKNSKTEYAFDDFYKAVIIGSPNDNYIRTDDRILALSHLDTGTNFVHTRDSRLIFNSDGYLYVEDGRQRYHDNDQLKVYDTAANILMTELLDYYRGNDDSKLKVLTSLDSVIGSQGYMLVYDMHPFSFSASNRLQADVGSPDVNVTNSLLRVEVSNASAIKSTAPSTVTIKPHSDYLQDKGLRTYIVNADAVKATANTTVNLEDGSSMSVTIEKKVLVEAIREAMQQKVSANSRDTTLQSVINDLSTGKITVNVRHTGSDVPVRLDAASASVWRDLANELD